MPKIHTPLGFETMEHRMVLTASTWGWGAYLLPQLEQENVYQNSDSELSQKVQKVQDDELLQKVQKVKEVSLSDIKDGTSNTFFVGEVLP